MRAKVFVTQGVFDEAISYLKEHVAVEGNASGQILAPDRLTECARNADGILSLLTDRIDDSLLAACTNLRIVANFAVGYNNIDMESATRRGILVTNTPDVLTETTADFAWCLLLATARRVVEADTYVRKGLFTSWGPKLLLGHDVFGKTLGIVGMGRIGRAVARRAQGFGMGVVFYDPAGIPESAGLGSDVRPVPLAELFRSSDFISVHVPLLPETHHLLDAAAFGTMKGNCIVINTARGPVVDEQALVHAVDRGLIAGAGLDVYEREPSLEPGLLRSEKVVLAPHIASASHETRLRMCMMAARNLVTALAGDRPPNLVNTEAWQ